MLCPGLMAGIFLPEILLRSSREHIPITSFRGNWPHPGRPVQIQVVLHVHVCYNLSSFMQLGVLISYIKPFNQPLFSDFLHGYPLIRVDVGMV
jgi:hypothetical protein